MTHYANGKECLCKMTPTDDGIATYAKYHPNADPNFNETVTAAIKKSSQEKLSYVN